MPSDRCLRRSYAGALAMLVSLGIAAQTRGQDPFGPSGGSDPFARNAADAPDVADPFDPVWNEPASEEERFRRVDEAIVRAERACERALGSNASAVDRFEAALSLLESALQSSANPLDSPHVIPSLEALARLRPEPWEPGSRQDMLQRLNRQSRGSHSTLIWELAARTRTYRRLTSEPWPMDWRRLQAFWLNLVETMLATREGASSSANWQRVIEAFPEQAMFCRLAYLVAIGEAGRNEPLDRTLVEPLREASKSSVRATVVMDAELLAALLATGTVPDDPFYVQIREELLRSLAEHAAKIDGLRLPGVAESLAKVYTSASRQTDERQRLVLAILVHAQPDAFQRFADRAGLDRSQIRQFRLAKPMAVDASGKTLAEVLEPLKRDAALSLWIDDSLRGERSRVDFGSLSGPWFELLEQIVQASSCHLELLGDEVLWVGRPDQLAAARAAYQHGVDQAQAAGGWTGHALTQQTGAEFIECPLRDVVQFLRDRHDVPIELLASAEAVVTLDLRGLPLHLCLTKLAASIGGGWCVSGPVILVGSDADMARLRRLERNRLRRWARLGLMDTPVIDALRDDTRLEFVFTPVDQVADFLSDQHGFAVQVSPAVAEMEFTADAKGITLEDALDCYFDLKHGVAWHTDGQTIFLGTPAEIEAKEKPPARK